MKLFVVDLLTKVLRKLYNQYEFEELEIESLLEVPPEQSMGDFSLPCFMLAKQLKKSPVVIALEIENQIEEEYQETWLANAAGVGGYLNIFIDRKYFIQKTLEEGMKEDYGSSKEGNGKTICMDYSSPNIAKNFHVGHLRTTVIGNSLYQIYSKLGYKVIRMNYLGDWGTQFGKLIVAYKLWSNKDLVEENGIDELLRIYIKFNQESEKDPKLSEEAREWFAKMEQGNDEALSIWKWFKEISMIEFQRVYKMLNIEFDCYKGECFYADNIPELVKLLNEKELLQESQGANIISLEEYGMPPCLITKKDGSSIYHSRDLAAAIHRKSTYDFTKCLYVTGIEQKLHFAQLFKALEKMGYDWAKECYHIPYGLVSMGGEKLSTRKGNIVYAEEILKEAITRAYTAIEEKSPNLSNKEEVAKKVGVGSVIFHDLSNQLNKNIQFHWEEVLNFDGMTAPYIQYTYARASSILRKASVQEYDYYEEELIDDNSYHIIKCIYRYPEVVKEAAEKYEPYFIARYAYQLAVLFNRFYQECRIIGTEPNVLVSRATVTCVVRKVIGEAMELLGIECPSEM